MSIFSTDLDEIDDVTVFATIKTGGRTLVARRAVDVGQSATFESVFYRRLPPNSGDADTAASARVLLYPSAEEKPSTASAGTSPPEHRRVLMPRPCAS